MTHQIFSCRNTLQRLRESHDRKLKHLESEKHHSVRVQYTVTYTDTDGNQSPYKMVRILIDIHTTDSKEIACILIRDFYKIDQSKILSCMHRTRTEQEQGSFNLVITKISPFEPTDVHDQM